MPTSQTATYIGSFPISIAGTPICLKDGPTLVLIVIYMQSEKQVTDSSATCHLPLQYHLLPILAPTTASVNTVVKSAAPPPSQDPKTVAETVVPSLSGGPIPLPYCHLTPCCGYHHISLTQETAETSSPVTSHFRPILVFQRL